MKKLTGVLLFLILVLVMLQIAALRALSRAENRIDALETKVESLSANARAEAVPAPAATPPAAP